MSHFWSSFDGRIGAEWESGVKSEVWRGPPGSIAVVEPCLLDGPPARE